MKIVSLHNQHVQFLNKFEVCWQDVKKIPSNNQTAIAPIKCIVTQSYFKYVKTERLCKPRFYLNIGGFKH